MLEKIRASFLCSCNGASDIINGWFSGSHTFKLPGYSQNTSQPAYIQTQTQTQTQYANPKRNPSPNSNIQTQTPKRFGFEFWLGACLFETDGKRSDSPGI